MHFHYFSNVLPITVIKSRQGTIENVHNAVEVGILDCPKNLGHWVVCFDVQRGLDHLASVSYNIEIGVVRHDKDLSSLTCLSDCEDKKLSSRFVV